MTIQATAQWEVRPTTGDNTNGAGFDSGIAGAGTDYSQQAAAQLSLTDLATTGAVTTLTSVTGGFTTAMVGNAIRINSGTNFTLGFYFITGYTDTNTVTIDRACTSAAGVAGNGKVGGATASLSAQTTNGLCSGGTQAIAAGNTVWVKNEAWNEAATVSRSGTVSLPVIVEGYNTVRGDAPTGSNRPHNNRGGSGIPLSIGGNNNLIKYLWLSHSGTTNPCLTSGTTGLMLVGCRFSNSGATSGSGVASTGSVFLVDCQLDTNVTGLSMTSGAFQCQLFGCVVHANQTGILLNSTGGAVVQSCLVYANTVRGISVQQSMVLVIGQCTLAANTGATTDAVHLTASGGFLPGSVLRNTIVSHNGRGGLYVTTAGNASNLFASHNTYYGNTGADRTNAAVGLDDVALDPQFVDAASGNFAIGMNLKALGWPGLFPGDLTTGYTDIGAVQREEPAPGGGLPVAGSGGLAG